MCRDARSGSRQVNDPIKSNVTSTPDPKVDKRFAHNTHSAVFAEMRLDEELGMLLLPHEELSAYPGSKCSQQGGNECDIEDFRRKAFASQRARQ
jgi:hypothetical protein